MNSGGMSNEEHTRLNIFLLSESIARTMRNSQDAPRDIVDSPENIIATPVVSVDQQFQEVNNFVEEQIQGLSEEQNRKFVRRRDCRYHGNTRAGYNRRYRNRNPFKVLLRIPPIKMSLERFYNEGNKLQMCTYGL